MTGRDKFHKLRHMISFIQIIFRICPLFLRKFFFILFRNIPGGIGIVLRYAVLSTITSIGKNVTILETVFLKNPDKFSCGNNVSIHSMCYIDASGTISIGDNVSLAHGVTILSETHGYKDMGTPIKYQPMIYKETKLGNNIWIGAKATILAGLHIADGSIIGANSVVTHDTSPDSVNAGAPSVLIKYRFS